jgi:Mrp family chromosome partitioning ATPase
MSKNLQLLEQLDQERRRTLADCRGEPDFTSALRPNIATRTYHELDKLVQRLFLSGPTLSRLVVFTGAAPGVGCTWISVHTAEVLGCQASGSVCLVDASTSSTGARERFNIPNGRGFADALTQNEPIDSFSTRVGSNLWIVAATGKPAASDVFSRRRVEARLLELRRQFDYVLIDTPSVAASSDSLTVGALADGAVLVVKAGHTRRPAVRLGIEELERAHVKVLGTVLNQREYPIPEAIYKRL